MQSGFGNYKFEKSGTVAPLPWLTKVYWVLFADLQRRLGFCELGMLKKGHSGSSAMVDKSLLYWVSAMGNVIYARGLLVKTS